MMKRPRQALARACRLIGAGALAVSLAWAPYARASPQEPPCKGCLFDAPAPGAGASVPLFVALHGDGGGAGKLHRALLAEVKRAGGALLTIQCPIDLGCRAQSFWQWKGTSGHDDGWLGAQIDAVSERAQPALIDRARTYAVGYSGGATYLGWYAPAHPDRFAAIAHVAGGMPWGTPCPACKYPVLFTIGPADPMVVPYTDPLRRYYERCGDHEVAWQSWRGVTHEDIVDALAAGRSRVIVQWLLARPSRCAPAVIDAGAIDASDVSDASAVGDASDASDASDVIDASPPAIAAPKADRGCACAIDGSSEGPSIALLGAAIALVIAFIRRPWSSGCRPWGSSRNRRSRGRTCRPRGSLGASTGSGTCTGLGSGS